MSSRSAYTAITPEYAKFPTLNSPIPADLNSSSSRLQSEESTSLSIDEGRRISSQIHSWLASAKDVLQRNTGLLLFVTSQAFLAFMNLAVKILNTIDPPITALELITIRMIITYVCCVTYMIMANVPDPILGPNGVRLLLLFRGFIGFFGLFGIYYSLQYLSLSDATVLTFLVPLCTAMAGALFLGEIFMYREAFAGLVSLLGVVLIARPTAIFGSASHSVPVVSPIESQLTTTSSPVEKGTQAERLIAVGVALIGVLGASGAYTTIRAIGKRAHPLHSLTFYSAMCIVVSIVGMIATKTPVVVPTRMDWLALLFMIGIFGFVGQVLLTMALQRETAGRSSLAIYTQIVFAIIFEKFVFDVVPSALSIAGTLLIIVSAVYVVLTKKKQDAPTGPTPRPLLLLVVSQDAEIASELEEGLLNSERNDGDKLDRRSVRTLFPIEE